VLAKCEAIRNKPQASVAKQCERTCSAYKNIMRNIVRLQKKSPVPQVMLFGALVIGIGIFLWYGLSIVRDKKTEVLKETEISGIISDMVVSARIITIQTKNERIIFLAIPSDVQVFNEDKREVNLNYLSVGILISARGTFLSDKSFQPRALYVQKQNKNEE